MALQPLRDTAGAGLSLLDVTLHSRVDPTGVVPKTRTRLLLAFKHEGNGEELGELISTTLSEIDADVMGLMVVQATSAWTIIEASPETVSALVRFLDGEAKSGGPRFEEVRIVSMTEDTPIAAFGAWTYRMVTLPTEAVVDLEAEPLVVIVSRLLRGLVAMGQQILQARGPGMDFHHVLEGFQDRFSSSLPSNERVTALAASPKLLSTGDWLEIYDSSDLPLPSDGILPLPARMVY